MMKCPSCGFENKNSAKFCIHCGKPLPVEEADAGQLEKLAFDLTANRAVSKKIASQNSTKADVIRESLAWIRTQEPSLFQDEAEDSGEELPASMPDLRQLDYEERIVCVLYHDQKMSIRDISALLGIDEGKVRGELQEAAVVSRPRDTSAASPEPMEAEESKPKRHRDWKKIMILTAAALVALILGIFFGVKRYASSRYDKGMELLSEEDYEGAEKAFASALQFSAGGDTEGRLGQVQYLQGKYEEAAEHLAAYHEEEPDDILAARYLASAYEKDADAYLAKKDLGSARTVLEKLYAVDQDPIVKLQIEAIDQDGTAEDEDGNVFNVYGRPKTLQAKDYRVDLTYDGAGELEQIAGYAEAGAMKSVCRNIDADHVYEIEWEPSSNGPVSWYLKEESLNDKDDPEEITFISKNDKENRDITYEYDEDGKISSAKWTDEDGTETEVTYVYSDQKIEITAGSEGMEVQKETVTLNEEGAVTERIIEQRESDPLGRKKPYRRIVYDMDALGKAYHSVVYNEDDEEIGEGWLLRDGSYITLFDE